MMPFYNRRKIKIILAAAMSLLMLSGNTILPRRYDYYDIEGITRLVADYLKNWGFCFYPKYVNHGVIDKLEKARKEVYVDSDKGIGKTEVVWFMEIAWPYRENLTLLQAYNTRGHRIKPVCKRKSEGWIKISTPIFSANTQQALIKTEIFCGHDCGASEWILVRKNISGWYVAQRIQLER